MLKRRGSAPQLTAVDQDRAISTSIIEAAKPKAQSTTPVLKPTALPALKTLNFKETNGKGKATPSDLLHMTSISSILKLQTSYIKNQREYYCL